LAIPGVRVKKGREGARSMADTPAVVMNTETSRFEARLGEAVAFAEYRLKPGVLVLPHTVVPDAFAGKGVASALAVTALGYARDHGLMVEPTCPFMAGYIRKHPEWWDIVLPEFQQSLGLHA
jgi:predicted GNAT family acetyltransferase